MAELNDVTAVKHATAMLLLLAMQDENGDFPNVDYVKTTPAPPDTTALPDTSVLQDLMPLVQPGVYQAVHRMMNENFANNPPVDYAMFQTAAGTANAFLLRLSLLNNLTLWTGGYPHPKGAPMREVISQLLA